ncbi:TonB-dependent receptor plug domain-containing protein [Pararoseomonas indoligenes]|uniref:TonB-dependent receptor n=1 Tax=Roseomonas indoligenes TaxID=2820811 RepID=A0A940N3I8_9PROT|nr:TonB-dependent receptor [Pararoseomonas indoligenes]MBP0496052.1 TonB-dependent receptor [Pararoseomonas indoligenes]
MIVLAPMGPAIAQDLTTTNPATVPEVVVTATRVPTPQDRIPASVTVIDRRTIQENGYTTLAEALAIVPGFRLVQSGGLGQQASGFARGTNARQVLVLLNGVPINDPSDPNGAFNFGNELLGDIERIEVVRGPVSAVYGSAAIGGVVNLITRSAPADRAAVPYFEAAGGSNSTVRGFAGMGGTVGAFDYQVTGQSLSTRGSNAVAPRFTSNLGERDGLRSAIGTVRLGLNIGETVPGEVLGRTRIEGLVRGRENTLGLDNVPNDDPNYTAQDRSWFGYLRSTTDLFGGAWSTRLTLNGSQNRRRYTNLPDVANPTATADDLYRADRRALFWDNTVRLPSAGPLTDMAVLFGGQWEKETADSANGSAFFRTTVDASQRAAAGYASVQGRLYERLDLTAGLRHDAPENYDGFTSWRVGGVLALPEISSRLRSAAGTAFKAPSLFQRFGTITGFFQGNPDLKPEESFSWEAGIETDVTSWATVSALYFDNRLRNLINYDASFTTLLNVERARIRGGEFALTVRPADWLSFTGTWTVQEARDTTNDQPLARRARNLASLTARLSAPVPWEAPQAARITVVPELVYTGPSPEGAFARYNDDGSSIGTPGKNRGGTVFNLTATVPVVEKVAGFVEIRNLGNSRYEPANGFVIPGRSALAGIRGTF